MKSQCLPVWLDSFTRTLRRVERTKVDGLREEIKKADKEFESAFQEQLNVFAERIQKSSGDAESAKQTAEWVSFLGCYSLAPRADNVHTDP